MRTRVPFLVLSACLAVLAACGGDNGGTNPPPGPTDQEVLSSGWTAFGAADYTTATGKFRILLSRGALLVEAHDALGWVFAYTSAPDSALVHFQAAVEAGSEVTNLDDEVQAGLAIVHDALGHPADALAATDAVATDWSFGHDAAINYQDMIVLRAVSYYALGQFAESLAEVQRLDSTFTADIDTFEGRAALAAKIESLTT